MTSSPRPLDSLGPASLASANVNLTSECRSLASIFSTLISSRIFRALHIYTNYKLWQPLVLGALTLVSLAPESPAVSGPPPVSDIRKQLSGDENREGAGAVLSDDICGEREQRDQYDTGTTAAAATSSAVFRVQDRCGPSQTLCVSVTTWHRGPHLSAVINQLESHYRESLTEGYKEIQDCIITPWRL